MIQEKLKKHKELILTSFLVFGPLLILAVIFLSANHSLKKSASVEPTEVLVKINPFDSVQIIGRSAYIKNLTTGEILYSKNENQKLALASLTKLMTVLAAQEILDDQKTITINARDLRTEGDTALLLNEQFNLKDLIDFTLVGSSNDGAAALAFSAGSILKKQAPKNIDDTDLFISYMNILAQKIGLENTTFSNETGLDTNEEVASAYGSAKDVAKLFEYVLKNEPSLLEATSKDHVGIISKNGFSHQIQNTNEIVNSLPNILGSKTGFTDIAGGNLSVIIDPGLNNPISITVLGSTKDGRFQDVTKLADTTLEYLQTFE